MRWIMANNGDQMKYDGIAQETGADDIN